MIEVYRNTRLGRVSVMVNTDAFDGRIARITDRVGTVYERFADFPPIEQWVGEPLVEGAGEEIQVYLEDGRTGPAALKGGRS